jgi:hypothetical protein
MLNKKAQYAEGILPVIALVLAVLTIFSFLTFDANIQTRSKDKSQLTTLAIFKNQLALEETKILVKETLNSCNYCRDSEALTFTLHQQAGEKEKYLPLENYGNLFGRLRNIPDFFLFVNPQGNYQLEIQNVFLVAQIGNSKITRNFNICQTFDAQGNYLEDCKIQ